MNGARTTFVRRDYLLTALAAAALLALFPGTAAAQQGTGVTITGPPMNTVGEGGTATYTVAIRGYVDAATDTNGDGTIQPTEVIQADRVTVTLATPAPDTTNDATTGEAVDLNDNAHTLVVDFDTPSNSSSSIPRLFTGSKTISVVTLHDNDAENEHFTLEFSLTADGGLDQGADNDDAIILAAAGTAARPNALIIDDDETQTYALSVAATATPTEGVALTVTGTATPAHVQGSSGALDLYTDPADGYTLGAQTLTIDSDPTTNTVTVTQDADDGNRVADTVTLSAYMRTPGPGADTLVASLPITFADANALPAVTVTVTTEAGAPLDPQTTSVSEGDTIHVVATAVNMDGDPTVPAEDLTVKLMVSAAGSADARDIVQPQDLSIATTATGATSGPQELTIFGPDDDVGVETLVLDAVVSGVAANGTETSTSSGVLTLTIIDNSDKQIQPKDNDVAYPVITDAIAAGAGDDGLNPGETVEITTSELFTLMDGYTASYGVSVEGDAVSASASGSTVTINASKTGTAHVTITGTATMASSSLTPSQTVSNVASLTFPVEVVDQALVLTVSMPDNVMNGNIVEGSSYTIGVSANRMVTEAEESVTVTFMRDRSQSDADENDYSVTDATIMAGYDSGEATLDVTEDMMDDAGHAAGEALVLYAESDKGTIESDDLMFTIWDEAVPALPLIAHILLTLFLALGGARLYRRRQG